MSKPFVNFRPKDPPPRVTENKALMKAYNWFPSDFKNTVPHKHARLLLKSKIRSNSIHLKLKDLKTPYLLSIMKRCKNARRFSFDITCNMHYNDKDIYEFSRTLSQFKRLNELEINTANAFSKITDQGLKHLIKRATKGLRLTNVNFDTSLNKNITDQSLTNFAHYLPKAKKLNKFSLKIMRNENITNGAVNKLCKVFPKLSKLSQLSISFPDCSNLTSETVLAVSRTVKSLNQLNDLSIALETYCKDDVFAEFKNSLFQLEGLHQLQLQFELRPVTDKRINELTAGFKSLKHLENLSLILPMNYELTDNGINDMAQNIAELQHLNHLRIEIWRSATLSDQSMKNFIQHIIQLKHLESLELSFSYMENLTNNGIASLNSLIKQMTNLSKFWLIIRCCDKIDNDSEAIQNLKKIMLETLNLKEKIITIIK